MDDLEAMVAPVFGKVVNKDVVRPEWLNHPFGTEELRKVAYMPPVEDLRELNILFPLPDYRKFYKSRVREKKGSGKLLPSNFQSKKRLKKIQETYYDKKSRKNRGEKW